MKNYLPKLLLTGGNGQLAHAILHHSHAKDFHIHACTRTELDITQVATIKQAIQQYQPDVLINTAAYTAVDKAEQEVEQAMQVNHLGAKHLALICEDYHLPLIHVSTDYIFDGEKTSPYHEEDQANPINVYGESKWLAEEAVRNHCEQHVILRVSGIFSEYGNNFLKTMLRLAQERKELRVVADQLTCPTYAGDIASAIFLIAKQLQHWGTYHFCNAESVSWHQFAAAIIAEARQHTVMAVENLRAITAAEYQAAAKRPAYSVLDCSKIKNNFGVAQTSWQIAVKHVVAKHLHVHAPLSPRCARGEGWG